MSLLILEWVGSKSNKWMVCSLYLRWDAGMVTLLQDEKVVSQQDGAEMKDVGKGMLYLTNKRIIFETVSGFLFKKTKTALAVNLSDVSHVEGQGGSLVIGTVTASHLISAKDSVGFASLAEATRKELNKSEVAAGQPGAPKISQAPPPPLTSFCPFCGTRLASNVVFCDSCGKRVK